MRRGGTAVALACIALAASAASASAAPGGQQLAFRLSGSHGYEISVISRGATAFIGVAREGSSIVKEGVAESVYITHARASSTRLDADFGARGHVALRFRRAGDVVYSKRYHGCSGPSRYAIRSGVFVGSVRFDGEGAYTAARARRVAGSVVTPARLHCRGLVPPPPLPRTAIWLPTQRPTLTAKGLSSQAAALGAPNVSPFKLTSLQAAWRLGVAAQAFGALDLGQGTLFVAASLGSEGHLATYRLAFAIGHAGSLEADDALGHASVKPPAPFGGEGTFEHLDNGTKEWSGSLAVSFPGAPKTPLTGPQFKVSLTRSL